MPRNDDATRRTARERSQARMDRSGGSSSRSSTDSYGRARQESDHLSETRYSRQASRDDGQSSRELEGASRRQRQSSASKKSRERGGASREGRAEGASRSSRASRTARGTESSRASRSSGSSRNARGSDASRSGSRQSRRGSKPGRGGAARDAKRQPSREAQRRSEKQKASSNKGAGTSSGNLPSFAVPAAIGAVVLIALLALVFGVLVPSCSQSGDSSSASSASSGSSASAAPQGIVHQVGQAKAKKQAEVESVNQVGSLETSNANVEALVSLLGEEEAAKLVAQAKTNPDALWIAAHPDAYAFDGIEIQYKILKLAADEPASIPYVREFPSKYPMADQVIDKDQAKDLAMDVASPSSAVPTTSIPHLYQWDRRWAYTIYSSASFGLTGCGPTSLAMVYQGLKRTVDKTPFDMAVLAEERGYMSQYNGTDSSFFTDIAPELGLNCWYEYPDATNIRDELKQGHVIIANLGPGYFTANGHFFVLAGLTDDGQVIVNDPYSVVRSSQTWDAEFIASETMAMFVYSKA